MVHFITPDRALSDPPTLDPTGSGASASPASRPLGVSLLSLFRTNLRTHLLNKPAGRGFSDRAPSLTPDPTPFTGSDALARRARRPWRWRATRCAASCAPRGRPSGSPSPAAAPQMESRSRCPHAPASRIRARGLGATCCGAPPPYYFAVACRFNWLRGALRPADLDVVSARAARGVGVDAEGCGLRVDMHVRLCRPHHTQRPWDGPRGSSAASGNAGVSRS